ncbi:microtubule-actin cross-linking factor 1-like isoform X7 [Brachionus plicatilis]|uniref:Microtubule-actin cross-linking factor 1-like isoform X7 n=1 Tax=Brachionus plicatilis TaxID=10195 RepID=A0A3M7T9K3_BRAPC|nr:microtubule-actin cross-linking factor 1-like isoform X7 [Brachionus plicatilis]
MWDPASDRFVSKPPQHINHIQLSTDFSPFRIRRNIRGDISPPKRLSLSQFPIHFTSAEDRSSKRANSIARFIYHDEFDSHLHDTESFSPFTYIKTTSIKRVPRLASSNRYIYNSDVRSTRSTPNRSVKQSPSLRESRFSNKYSELNPFENYIRNDFESNDLKSFESELEKSFKKFESFEKSSSSHLVNTSQMRQQLDSMRTESENLRHNSNIYQQNLNLVKNLISLLEGSNVWITKLEERLCGQESMKILDNLNGVLSRLERDLEDVASSAKQRQNEIKQIRDLTEKIKASKSNIASDILNLSEIIEIAGEIKKRFSNILSQIAERQVLLGDIQHSLDLYEKAYKTETKWINMLKSQKEHNQTTHKLNENIFQQTNMHDDITELKKRFDPVAQIYTELGTRSSQVDFLNETGIQLVSQLRKFSEILTDYREKTVHQALDLAAGPDTIVNQIRSEVNNLNREYSSLLKEYNQKVKTIVNSLSKSDKQFTLQYLTERFLLNQTFAKLVKQPGLLNAT